MRPSTYVHLHMYRLKGSL